MQLRHAHDVRGAATSGQVVGAAGESLEDRTGGGVAG